MKKSILVVLAIMFLIGAGGTCFAAEKQISNNIYYLSAKRLDENTLQAKTKLKGLDGSYIIYTYVIDTKTKESVETQLELYDSNHNKTDTVKMNFHHVYGTAEGALATIIVDEAINEVYEKEKKK